MSRHVSACLVLAALGVLAAPAVAEEAPAETGIGFESGGLGHQRVGSARLLTEGQVALFANGGYGIGDPLQLGTRATSVGGSATVGYGATGQVSIFARTLVSRTTLVETSAPRPLGGPTVPSLSVVAGRKLPFDLRLAGSLDLRLPAIGKPIPRVGVGGYATWEGPIRLDVQLAIRMADDTSAASPLYRAAAGAWARDRLDVGAAASLPMGVLRAFLEYDAQLPFCGSSCSGPFAMIDPSLAPQRVGGGFRLGLGPMELVLAAEMGLDAKVGARRPDGVPALPQYLLRAGLEGSFFPGRPGPEAPEPAPKPAPRPAPKPQPKQPPKVAPKPVPVPTPVAAPAPAEEAPPADPNARRLDKPVTRGLSRLLLVVVDGYTGEPVPDALVSAWAVDERGRLDVEVPPGTIELNVEAPGYDAVVRKVTLPRGETASLALYLTPPSAPPAAKGHVSGSVVDGRGNPLTAELTFRPFDGGRAIRVIAEALFEVALPAGKYAVEARAEGFQMSELPLEVKPGAKPALDFMLADGGPPLAKADLGEVNLFDPLEFAPAEAKLLPASLPGLDALALLLLKEKPQTHLLVSAYVMPTDDEARDVKLSEARARLVAQALVARGVAASRLDIVGNGSRPILTIGEDRYRNDRVEFFLTEDAP